MLQGLSSWFSLYKTQILGGGGVLGSFATSALFTKMLRPKDCVYKVPPDLHLTTCSTWILFIIRSEKSEDHPFSWVVFFKDIYHLYPMKRCLQLC